MEIYIIRHGIAVDLELAANDNERWLTPRGVSKTQKLAQQLKEKIGKFDVIITSPLVRAQQTAQILVANGLSKNLEIQNSLAPGGSLSDWLAWLKTYSIDQLPLKRIALVGHAPDLGLWAELLVFGQATGRLQLKKSGFMAIEAPDQELSIGQGQLLALVPPKYWL